MTSLVGVFLLTSELKSEARRAKGELAASSVILIAVVTLSPVVFVLIYRMTLTIQNYALGLSKKTKELRREKKRSDTLLYQMLPKSVALQLKLSKKVMMLKPYNSYLLLSAVFVFERLLHF